MCLFFQFKKNATINNKNLFLGVRTSFMSLENVIYSIYTKCSITYTACPKVTRKEYAANTILTHYMQ